MSLRLFGLICHLLIDVAIFTIIVRSLLSYLPLNPWHPVARFIRSVADPLLRPFRGIMPTMAGIDFSPLLAIITLQILDTVVRNLVDYGVAGVSLTGILLLVVGTIVRNILLVICIIVLLRVIVTVANANPFHPATLFIRQFSNPMIRPFEGLVGGRRDTAPFVALAVYVVLYFVAGFLFSR